VGARRRGRESALQMLYQVDLSGVSPRQATRQFWEHLASSKEGQKFATSLVEGWGEHRARIDGILREVSQHWRLERMSKVDRNILRLGTYELLERRDIPRRVTLNEAVELAKKYGAEQSPGFVNGVLDRIAQDLGRE
jgi:N utilization substance protein B